MGQEIIRQVLSQSVSELKPMMFSQVEAEFPRLVTIEDKVKTVLGDFGISSW